MPFDFYLFELFTFLFDNNEMKCSALMLEAFPYGHPILPVGMHRSHFYSSLTMARVCLTVISAVDLRS